MMKIFKLLHDTDFREILDTECPDKAFNEFINRHMDALQLAFPQKEINTPKIATESKLLLDKHKNHTDENIEKYKNICRIYKKLRTVAQANLYDEQNLSLLNTLIKHHFMINSKVTIIWYMNNIMFLLTYQTSLIL